MSAAGSGATTATRVSASIGSEPQSSSGETGSRQMLAEASTVDPSARQASRAAAARAAAGRCWPAAATSASAPTPAGTQSASTRNGR